ncbi:MAG: hydrogenase iron-sulfur subunit [Chloroflexota bacterium]|nr:hydrogenase iron-sulfur subunit [Chloroflexota bacterium]
MGEPETRVIVFTCNWNAYSGLETAGVEGLSYPASVYPVKVMCLGRLHPGVILKAFERGADGVLLLGCPADECHYGFGNRRAEEMFAEARALVHLLGVADERLRLDWLVAGDGDAFLEKVTEFMEQVCTSQSSVLPALH